MRSSQKRTKAQADGQRTQRRFHQLSLSPPSLFPLTGYSGLGVSLGTTRCHCFKCSFPDLLDITNA
eukprot:1477338-Amphidinium_carterae.2